MYKAEGGMGMRLGERERQPDHTPYAQVGPSSPKFAQVKNLRRRVALFRFVPGDCCRETSGCRLGQRPCMTRTPQRTSGHHAGLLQLARSLAEHTACMRLGLFFLLETSSTELVPCSCHHLPTWSLNVTLPFFKKFKFFLAHSLNILV